MGLQILWNYQKIKGTGEEMMYKVEIRYQTREYGSQIDVRNAMIELLEAGVFHVKTDTTDDDPNVKKKRNLFVRGDTVVFVEANDEDLEK